MDSIINIFKILSGQSNNSNNSNSLENSEKISQNILQEINDNIKKDNTYCQEVNDDIPQSKRKSPESTEHSDKIACDYLNDRPAKKSKKDDFPPGEKLSESKFSTKKYKSPPREKSPLINFPIRKINPQIKYRYVENQMLSDRNRSSSEESPKKSVSTGRSRSPPRQRSRSPPRQRSRSPPRQRSRSPSRPIYRSLPRHKFDSKKIKNDKIISETVRHNKKIYDYNPIDDTYYEILENGTKIWYKGNLIHRDELPAMICEDGTKKWYQYGQYERGNDLPSIESGNGRKIWYFDGKIGRIGDAPAVIEPDGELRWYKDGKYHRDNGPAVIKQDGTMMWYYNGKLHRDEMPAIVQPNIVYKWYKNGLKHRDNDLPAIINVNGDLVWYLYDQIHRDNDPAVIRKNGVLIWYKHGEKIREEKVSLWEKNEYRYIDIIKNLYREFPYLIQWHYWNPTNSH
ncbi:hypothetical protein QJ850_gp035 [Acanthamoeba polyphaga mimivirus]|uniref:Uncharacterized protein n=1 Tax=Acanthamoeba polyphaga mimivirus Kroon TaxID=3069720 RepID=A0A0G2Y5C1_9VIRU|nr:hypothetical protein QJ850_gp035 [Acanthamoeba polyphaga mimivirus]AKI79764.1 hypothetical protein [Acanthamoeba polyphaga mimivirus Kroon]